MANDALLEEAGDLLPDAMALRRELHQRPEIGNDLPITQELVLEALDGLPLTITKGESTSGIVAVLEGGGTGPTVLLRGDMDALPMHEDTGLEFSSRHDHSMHACGHDLHTSMLVGAARQLAARRDELAGQVVFMFQPGEEGHHGARFMLDEGLLDAAPAAPVTSAFALHVISTLPTGMAFVRGGTMMASADEFTITVTGRGGHGSSPHQALDPVPVACEIVMALQSMITRRIDTFDPAVVTVTQIHTGTTNNVIPEKAFIDGTIRAVSEATRAKVHAGIQRVAEGVGAAHEATAEVEVIFGYPVTVNDSAFADLSLSVAANVLGEGKAHRMPSPVMGAEDFSYVLQKVPGAMMFLGAAPPDASGPLAPNHSNRVFYDEATMQSGIALYSAVALDQLAR
jgi:hippurate hydrolase